MMEPTCKHMSKHKLLISNQEVTLQHKSAIFFTVLTCFILDGRYFSVWLWLVKGSNLLI